MSGTAMFGRDYTLSDNGRVIIPAGQSTAEVVISAKKSKATGVTKTAIMTLQPGKGYTVGPKKDQATVTILYP